MLRVGLTGGIGSGKSEVSRRLARHGAIIIDADRIAREVVEPGTPGLAAVVGAFGPGVLRPDGALDRDRLAERVFADPAELARLNAIVHPLVGARMRELDAAAPPGSVVVHDVPLLVENDLAGAYDVVVVVDVPPEVATERLVRLRGMPTEQAAARIAAQAPRDRRLAAADHVIDNTGSLDDLDRCVAELWKLLQAAAGR